MPKTRTYLLGIVFLVLYLALETFCTHRTWQISDSVLTLFIIFVESELLSEDVVVDLAFSLLSQFLVVLVLSLDFAFFKSGGIVWQIVHTGHLILSAVGGMIHLELLVAHRVDAQREVSVEVEESEGEKSKQFFGHSRPEVKIITAVEKEHEVGFSLGRQDNSTDVLNVVVAASLATFEGVNIVRGLDVDAVNFVRGAVCLQLLALVLDHDVLVGIDKLLYHLIRDKFGTLDHS